MKVYLVDGRAGEVDLSIDALRKLKEMAAKDRHAFPIQVKINGHFEIVAISAVDFDRTVNQPKTLVGWTGYHEHIKAKA